MSLSERHFHFLLRNHKRKQHIAYSLLILEVDTAPVRVYYSPYGTRSSANTVTGDVQAQWH